MNCTTGRAEWHLTGTRLTSRYLMNWLLQLSYITMYFTGHMRVVNTCMVLQPITACKQSGSRCCDTCRVSCDWFKLVQGGHRCAEGCSRAATAQGSVTDFVNALNRAPEIRATQFSSFNGAATTLLSGKNSVSRLPPDATSSEREDSAAPESRVLPCHGKHVHCGRAVEIVRRRCSSSLAALRWAASVRSVRRERQRLRKGPCCQRRDHAAQLALDFVHGRPCMRIG